jgi:hypothetical protein
MQTDIDDKTRKNASSSPWKESVSRSRLIDCPFEVRSDGVLHDQFYDVRDALASARAAKRNERSATVVVTEMSTGKLVIEVDG